MQLGSSKIDALFVKGERKRVVLVKGSKLDETNNMKAQLIIVSHEMCSEFYHIQWESPERRE